MRRLSSFTYRFLLPTTPERAFALLAEPRTLDAVTPPWFRLRPVPPLPSQLEAGLRISYRLRWRGLPLRWTSLITDWQPSDFFAYEQQRGPYRFFRHEHSFEAVAAGTEITDRVLFRAPGGALTDRLIAKPDLARIFAFREHRATVLLGAFQRGPELTPNSSQSAWSRVSRSASEPPTWSASDASSSSLES